MPLGLENFQPETFEQANPVAAGYAATLGMNQTALQNQLLQAQAQYAPQNAQSAAQSAQAQASLAQFQAQNPASQLPGIAGQIGGINALQKLGLISGGQGSNAAPPANANVAAPVISSGAPPSALSQSLPTLPNALNAPSSGAPTSQLPFNAQDLQNLALQSVALPMRVQLSQLDLNQQRGQYYQNLIGNMSVQNAQKFANSPEGQAAIASDPDLAAAVTNKLTGGAGVNSSPQAVSAVQALAQNKTSAQEFTPQQLQMLPFAKSLDLNIQQAAPLIAGSSAYTGATGQVQYLKDKAAVAAGNPAPQSYQDLQQLEAKMPAITSDIRRVLGDHATDYQTQQISDVLDPKEWDSNPAITMQKFQSLVDSAHASLQALSQTN